MPRISTLKYGRAYVFGLLALICIGWGVYAAVDALRPPEAIHVRLAAGSAVARRFQVAQALAVDAFELDLNVDVVATGGFEDSVQQVVSGKLDLALVSSGLDTANSNDLRLLAGLDVAPLHILVRRHLAEKGLSLNDAIKGRTVNLGQPGTNDYMLANDVLRFLRLQPKNATGAGDFTVSTLSKDDLTQLAQSVQSQTGAERDATRQRLPDVIMTVASLPGVLAQNLLDTGEYTLAPFPNVEPFLMSELHHVGGVDGGVDRVFVEPTAIHPGMYVGDASLPQTDCPTIGLRTLLVARADLPDATVRRVMEGVFTTDFLRRVKPQSPCDFAAAYEIHPAATAFLDRDKPLLTGPFFDSISSFLSIFGAFTAGALSLYGYLRRRRVRKPGEYLDQIRKIDALASGEASDTEVRLSPEALNREIDTRLNQLKEQVITDYCENRVQGEMVLLSILSTLADSRSRLHVTSRRTSRDRSEVQIPAMRTDATRAYETPADGVHRAA